MSTQEDMPILVFRIALQYVEPGVWRRFRFPAHLTLDRLHRAVQIVMGWEDEHLYEFSRGKERYGVPDRESRMFGVQTENAKKVTVASLNLRRRSPLHYLYDFGDSWEHELRVEDVLTAPDDLPAVWCLEGARACPPEDCGSVPGYEELVRILRDPSDPEYESMVEWCGGDYDPEAFHLGMVNERLRRSFRARTARR